ALEAVDVKHVEPVGAQPLQARLQLALRLVALASGDLGLEEDLAAPTRHEPAHALLALAVAVVVRGVDVGESEIDCAGQPPPRLVVVLVGQEPAAAAEGEERHLDARGTERTCRQLAGRSEGLGAERAEGRRPQERATGDAHRSPPSRHTASAGCYRSFSSGAS